MGQLTHAQYDVLERAITTGSRVSVRRGARRESVVIPLRLEIEGRREVIAARNPTTGHDLRIYVDEIESVEAVG
jgi:hypothetical protein